MSLALSESQHSKIMKLYQDLRNQARIDLNIRRKKAYSDIPKLKELDLKVSDISIKCYRNKDKADTKALAASIEKINAERIEILKENGLPEDYLNLRYTCSLCQDTGYIDDKRCSCFNRKIIELVYSDKRWQNIFKEENFDSFNLGYYSDSTEHSHTGRTPKAQAMDALDKAHRLVDHIVLEDNSEVANLIIMGNTGTGKTFLCNCIAKDLIDAGKYVIYLTAPSLCELFERASFSGNTPGREFSPEAESFSYSDLFDCDLLIIDDLGTECANSFTASKLFEVLNRRMQSGYSTLISTNQNLQGLQNSYTERITSRLIGNYKWVSLFGEDIRLKKGGLMPANMPERS